MDSFGHIAERFLIHFTASLFLLLAFFFAIGYWIRRNAKVAAWISPEENHLLLFCALLVFSLLPLREPWDVWLGQSPAKAVTDQLSWFLGPAVGVWGLYRFRRLRR